MFAVFLSTVRSSIIDHNAYRAHQKENYPVISSRANTGKNKTTLPVFLMFLLLVYA